jgi:hypothetical protein
MQLILKVLSFIALATLLAAPVLYFAGSISKAPMQTTMLIATLLWFATAPFWMGRKPQKSPEAS